MADEQDVLLREIDEDLKNERLAKIWNTYGNYAIAGALVLVIGVAGTKAWQSYDLDQRRSQGEQLAEAARLADDGKSSDALSALQKLATDAGGGYAMLARFQAAAITGRDGDAAKAAELYGALAADSSIGSLYRDLATVLGALQEIDAGKLDGQLLTKAAGIAKAAGPWRHNAREVEALSALASGDKKAADGIFKELSEAADAPQGLRSRAGEMLKITGNN